MKPHRQHRISLVCQCAVNPSSFLDFLPGWAYTLVPWWGMPSPAMSLLTAYDRQKEKTTMRRARLWPAALVALALVFAAGCAQNEINPFDPSQDPDAPVVTGFVYSGGEAQWSTDEPALCVLEYGTVGGGFEHYVYESTKYHSTFHRVTLLGMEEGVDYEMRVRSIDRAGNEGYEVSTQIPDSIAGEAFGDLTMTLAMIDVGWGLSMVLTTPSGANVLIDAGYTGHLDDVLAYLDDHSISYFDAAVVTHYHIDHYGGYGSFTGNTETEVDGILNMFGVGVFVAPDTTNLYREMVAGLAGKIDRYNVDVEYVGQGDSSWDHPGLAWDSTPGFEVTVLSAGVGGLIDLDDDSGTEGMNTNNDSVVLKLSFGDVSFITTGDGEHFTEYGIIDAFGREGIRADLLQIAHHGSDDSSSELWLDNVSPRIGLISCAMIEAALEKEEVLQGIRAVNADYFVTDRIVPNTPRNVTPTYGNVIAVTDGSTIEITTEEHAW